MAYQSLIRFLDYAGVAPEAVATTSITRMKKLAQAEFALQPGGIITLEGISFTSNDVLQELDHPDVQQRLRCHLLLWEHKDLLELLEQDHLNMDRMDQWRGLCYDVGFRNFISSYFATAFHSAMTSLLGNKDLYNASIWIDYLAFVLPEDEERALRSVRLFLEDALKLFRNLNDTSYRDRMEELKVWRDDSWSLFIDKLPRSLMPYADELANAIINFTVRIQKADRKLCFELSSGLVGLQQVNYSLRGLIRNNHEIYRKKLNRGVFNMPSLYPVVVGLIILIRVLSGMDFSSSSSGNNTEGEYQATMEGLAYQGIRLFFNHQYGTGQPPARGRKQSLRNVVFSDKPVYLFLENWPGDGLSPVALVNNTRERIKVDLISAGNVSNVTVGSHDILGIQPEREHNMDMILTFHQEDPRLTVVPETKYLQFLFVSAEPGRVRHNLNFAKEERVSLPLIQPSSLKDIPLVMTIDERDSGYVFSLKGKAGAVNYRTLPAAKK
ncbi:hypothetical protein [Taibaiella helva]|uniref:hypothetical protein n=1 Tax=Taibaiella helva TaxID=2301235 RepID=UPI000E58C0AB|nr:hypothetical protein [Taibaiella helva]